MNTDKPEINLQVLFGNVKSASLEAGILFGIGFKKLNF
jgi:hypothetical protein